MTRRIVPDQVLERPEPLPEAEALSRVPSAPFAFMWFLIRKHFLGHVIVLVLLSGSATSVEAFGPYALSRLINAITAAVETKASFGEAILPWLVLLAAIWLGSTLAYRAYEAVDVGTSPRMRALAQKYMFTYLMGHSPRYFQENFAGKLGQKVKQAGQATVGILGILAFDMVRVAMLMLVGGVLMFFTHAAYAIVLAVWAVALSRDRGRARQALRRAVEGALQRDLHLHRAADRRHRQLRPGARLRQGRLRAPLHFAFPARRDECLAPAAQLPHHHAQLHVGRDAGAAARPRRAGRDGCALGRDHGRRVRDDLLPRQPDHPERAGTVLPHARLLRAIGHARRSAGAGEPAPRDRRCAGCQAARRPRRRHPLREHPVRPSRRASGVRRSEPRHSSRARRSASSVLRARASRRWSSSCAASSSRKADAS